MKHADAAQLAKDARAATGLQRPEFARLIGAGLRSVDNWERGEKPPLGPARLILVGLARGKITATLLRELAK